LVRTQTWSINFYQKLKEFTLQEITQNPDHLLVANLQNISLEQLVKSKLEVLFDQQKEANVEINGLYGLVIEQVEKPLIELALRVYNGNQVRTAQMLGINRNTLKKKIDNYNIKTRTRSKTVN
jgi:Fis family transcriptional regulator, factor for inversion stimulation protein